MLGPEPSALPLGESPTSKEKRNLFSETWHYRYVGIVVAREIAEGKYNGGQYDSLEHYLKATGRIENLLAGEAMH